MTSSARATLLKVSTIAVLAMVLTAVVTAVVIRGQSRVPTNAAKTEFCDYWNNFGSNSSPDDPDPFSVENFERLAEEWKALGVPADASEQVRKSLELRIDFVDARAEGELTDQTDPTGGDKATWFALEDYVAREC